MDFIASSKRKINPRQNASWFSIITYIFAIKIFRKCSNMNEEDVYEVIGEFGSQKLGDILEERWKARPKTKLQFVGTLMGMFTWQIIILGGSLLIIEPAIVIAFPLLTGKLVSYFTPEQTELSFYDAVLIANGMTAITIVYIVYFNLYYLFIREMGLKMRTACCSLMYRKCLKLNQTSMNKYADGKVVTLMTKDILNFSNAIDFLIAIPVGLVEVVIMTYMMYNAIGVSALLGASLLFIVFMPQAYLGKQAAKYRIRTAEKTDERLRITHEILSAIRIIKMYTWEFFFTQSISTLRKKEIRNLRLLFYLKAFALSIGHLSAMFAFYICVMTYIALGNHITAEKAYIVTGCFGALRSVLTLFIPMGIAETAELIASIERITTFLLLEDIHEQAIQDITDNPQTPQVVFKEVTVQSYTGEEVLTNLNLDIESGITLLTGSVGSGKSTFIKLILGEIEKVRGSVEVNGSLSYASQDPWIFPATIRQNIIFSEEFDEARYQAVIDACDLKKDLDSFPLYDKTCVSDRGLNLSKGQKARVNLARAVYKKADIYLLDDCLSSVDTHVGCHIFEKCIKDLLKDSIRIFVTHQFKFIQDVDNIVILNTGHIEFKGNYLDVKDWNTEEFNKINFNRYATEETVLEDPSNKHDQNNELLTLKDQNIYEETRQHGSVKIGVYYKYFTAGGGLKIFILFLFVAIITQATTSWSDYFVSFWVDMEQALSGYRHNQTTNSTEYKELEESHSSVMTQYSIVITAAAIFTLLRAFVFFIFSSKASINLHNMALDKIINAAMKFFDTTLYGNIINRFSRDFAIIDEQTPFIIFECIWVFLKLIAVLFVISSVNSMFYIPSTVFAVILYFAQKIYIPTGRSLRRLEGATRSPVIGHLTSTLEGLATIRASGAQKILQKEFDTHQDLYNSVSYMSLATTRGFGFFMSALSAFFEAVVILTFILMPTDTLAGKVGLAITQSFSLNGLLQWGVRQWTQLETQMTSTERVLEYTTIEPEKKSGNKISTWPIYGGIRFEDVSLQYSATSQLILKGISFAIEPKEKIGVVGRTGAGKTSIISSLFRLYEYDGTISIDGVDIKNLEIELVRSKISIIPQDPVLFSGSIRSNLDPRTKHSDAEIWDALDAVEIKKLIASLDTHISEGGSNFSIGQRQQFCLVRAILNNNKILVLDEATANLDPQTDSLIQQTIRRRFSDCTIITIAHRLHTILDSNKVLVLDSGIVVEFDAPISLLSNRNGLFYKMVKEAGLLHNAQNTVIAHAI